MASLSKGIMMLICRSWETGTLVTPIGNVIHNTTPATDLTTQKSVLFGQFSHTLPSTVKLNLSYGMDEDILHIQDQYINKSPTPNEHFNF